MKTKKNIKKCINRKKLLATKIALFTILISIFSVVIAFVSNLLINYNYVNEKDKEIATLLVNNSVREVNNVLNNVANLISKIDNNENFYTIYNVSDKNSYEALNAFINLESELNNYLLSNDAIDGVILNFGDKSFYVADHNILAYNKNNFSFHSKEYFDSIQLLAKNGNRHDFYLDTYRENNLEINKTVITSPLFLPQTDKIIANVIVVLNEEITSILNYEENKFIISDSLDVSVSINDNKQINLDSFKQGKIIKRPLMFDEWFLIINHNKLSFRNFFQKFNSIFISCFIYLIVIVVIAFSISKVFVNPIHQLRNQIGKIGHQYFSNEHIKLKKRKIKFQVLLMLYFILLGILPVIGMSIAFYAKTSSILISKIGNVIENQMDITTNQITFIMNDYTNQMFDIALDTDIQNNFIKSNYENESIADIYNDVGSILLPRLMDNPQIANVVMFNKKRYPWYSTRYNKNYTDNNQVQERLDYIVNNYGDYRWEYSEHNYISEGNISVGMQVLDILKETQEYGHVLGYLMVDYKIDPIMSALDSMKRYDAVMCMLDKNDETILFSTSSIYNYEEINQLLNFNKTDNDINILNNKKYLTKLKPIEYGDMSLFIVLPINLYMQDKYMILLSSIPIMVVLMLLSILFAYKLYSLVLNGVTSLLNVIRKVRGGMTNVRYLMRDQDEIDELGNSFNEMLDRLNLLMDEKVAIQMKSKELEISLLQSQINPHFLYNTLRTVQYMATVGDKRAPDVVKKLIYLFRNIVSKTDDEETLSNELRSVRYYLDIQQLRFPDKFEVSYDVPKELLESRILKLTIQPVVENTVYHGLELMSEGGFIKITIYEDDNDMVIRIVDNGKGIDENRLMNIKAQLEGYVPAQSIGLNNVNNRIKLHYGKKYGLQINSLLDKGTTITIRVPLTY